MRHRTALAGPLRDLLLALRRPDSPSRLCLLQAVAALVPIALLLALGQVALQHSHEQHEQRARLLTQNLSEALSHSLQAQTEKVDTALSTLVAEAEALQAVDAMNRTQAGRSVAALRRRYPDLGVFTVTDATGLVVAASQGSWSSTEPLSLADRPWFKAARDGSSSGLAISPPVIGRLLEQWVLVFSRPYRDADGRFAGSAALAVPVAQFTRQLQNINAGRQGLVTLRGGDLELIARVPQEGPGKGADAIGSRRVSDEMRALVNSGHASGTYRAVSPLDGIERMLSFRRLGGFPLLVTVGLSSNDYLADWRGEIRAALALGLGLLALYAAGGWLLWRLTAQNRVARRRIGLLARVFQHSGEAIMVCDRSGRIVEVNPAFVRQTGYRAAEVEGRATRLLDASRTSDADREAVLQALASDGVWRGERWARSRDGREYPRWVSVSVVRDRRGGVSHFIEQSMDITEAKLAEDRIHHLAHHDALTQLPNRAHLQRRLELALAAARLGDRSLALLFLDLDRFKTINDTLGHPVGDTLLVEVGRRLAQLVRDGDLVARLGGDEFVLVLPEAGASAARAASAVAAQVLAALGRPYRIDGHLLHSTPSIGIALFPSDGQDVGTLMRKADTAMYHAKASGRNNVQFFTPEMNQATQERLALEDGLRSAIDGGELFLHFQPQRHLGSQRTVGVEALLRWQHPTLGLIPPLKFIPVAEDTGMIASIGAWVLDAALRQVAQWRRQGHAELRVAVNLSAQQLRSGDLVSLVSQALARHDLPGQALELEITESVAMHDPTRTAGLLRELRTHGVALAIDDFGTGYSSLAYLKQLPLSCLKLDRSFVMDIEHDANDAAICTATIQLAHSLGLAVVAEGVETATQLEFLRRLGCDSVQGYYIGRPMTAVDCAAFLRDGAAAAVPALLDHVEA